MGIRGRAEQLSYEKEVMFQLPSPNGAVDGLLNWISPPHRRPLVGNTANEWRCRMAGILNEEQLDRRDEGGVGRRDAQSLKITHRRLRGIMAWRVFPKRVASIAAAVLQLAHVQAGNERLNPTLSAN